MQNATITKPMNFFCNIFYFGVFAPAVFEYAEFPAALNARTR
jgi:hypothetical protein